MNDWTSNLNDRQLEAVLENSKNMLILAGAGTGKTKTVVAKIGNIISTGLALPGQIMGLTFTNKAAREMKDRLSSVEAVGDIWLGTFHSICVRLLRIYYQQAGLDRNFIIADQDESYQVIKNVVKEAYPHISPAMVYKDIASAISRLKERGIMHDSSLVPLKDIQGVSLGTIYKLYQASLARSNLIDFDDIIILTSKLLLNNSAVQRELHERFKYVFVDEYQDTSVGQNELIKALVGPSTIVCCVGDEDQSIYSWRGASIDNILGFEKNFPSCKVVTLEKNYRSTVSIVDFAHSLIKQNQGRYNKNITAVAQQGNKVKIVCAEDGRSEAHYVAQEILRLKQLGVRLSSIAVLVRASFQNKSFEEAFNSLSVPYRIVDGLKFFDRKEVKDVIAYLRFAFSNRDEISFERIINSPRRGIGEKTVSDILSRSRVGGISPLQALKDMVDNGELRSAQAAAAQEFVSQMEGWSKDVAQDAVSVSAIVSQMAHQSGYFQSLKDAIDTDPTAEDRILNIQSLIGDLNEFDSVASFLEYMALASQKDTGGDGDAVNVGTIHGAKGLEFDYVFCPGWEESVFPSSRSLEYNSDRMIEEERRLGYVAITRAKVGLAILFANSRLTYGSWRQNQPSRFIIELRKNAPSEIFENIHLSADNDTATRNSSAQVSRSYRGAGGYDFTQDAQGADGKYSSKHSGGHGRNASGWNGHKGYVHKKRPASGYSSSVSEDEKYSEIKFTRSPTKPATSVPPGNFKLRDSSDSYTGPLAVGSNIEHGTFGVGRVERLLGNYAEVIFNGADGKRLIHRNFIKVVKQ